jgi:sulfur carrier protein
VKIFVNGAACEVNSGDLAGVLRELNYGDSIVATAVNGTFVPGELRSSARVSDGDRLEVLAPMQGG